MGESGMNLEPRIEQLRLKHAALDDVILEENHRPHPDTTRLAQLKREKLKLKDEIFRLEHDNLERS
jgi:hypothetical protein